MAPKKDKAPPPSSKPAKSGGGKQKKKKWSKGKQKEKVNNMVLFDQATYDKLLSEAPKYKLITPSILSDRMRINGSLARKAIRELMARGSIRFLSLVFLDLGFQIVVWLVRKLRKKSFGNLLFSLLTGSPTTKGIVPRGGFCLPCSAERQHAVSGCLEDPVYRVRSTSNIRGRTATHQGNALHDKGFLHSICNDFLFCIRCSRLLAHIALLLDRSLCPYNAAPDYAHDQIQVYPIQHRKAGAFVGIETACSPVRCLWYAVTTKHRFFVVLTYPRTET
ncbi:hypothetical protein PVK06_000044 [Gossypium arboreum]|uniref:40S ribosomal protein S25 n=1 Tax=Gossypium arboreum TaxID=29729 RepID=A0ABR0QX60_GOSAR|nr:hypothetical protein PVK06_000044 [Gossypium arboreum]